MDIWKTLNDVRNAIAVMRKWKEDNRMISEMCCCVATDVFDALKKMKAMTRDIFGKYFLDSIPVIELKGYPAGYVAVE